MAAAKSTGAARHRARPANEIRTHPRPKAGKSSKPVRPVKKEPSAETRPELYVSIDILDRLRHACDVIQTVGDALTSDGCETTSASMTLSLYALSPLLAIKDELAGADGDE